MRKVILIVVLFFVVMFLRGEKSVEISEISKPDFMVAHNGKLVIMEKPHIYIYSLKDFKLIEKFGREGEGPGEFKVEQYGAPMSISFPNDDLMVCSEFKLSYFSMDGKFLRQKKAIPNTVIYELGKKYIGVGPTFDPEGKNLVSFRILSPEFKPQKTLFSTEVSVNIMQGMLLPFGAFTCNPVYKNQIVLVASDDEFQIDIMNDKGEQLKRIEKTEPKIRISESFEKAVHDWFKHSPMFKPMYENMKSKIRFKSHFPAIRDINLADDKIHVITYKRKGELWECIVLDFEGKELNRLFIPMSDYIPFSYYALLYSVDNGKLYSLVEDPDEEVWKLHVLSTKK